MESKPVFFFLAQFLPSIASIMKTFKKPLLGLRNDSLPPKAARASLSAWHRHLCHLQKPKSLLSEATKTQTVPLKPQALFEWWLYTVDGRNPAPVDMVNIPLFKWCCASPLSPWLAQYDWLTLFLFFFVSWKFRAWAPKSSSLNGFVTVQTSVVRHKRCPPMELWFEHLLCESVCHDHRFFTFHLPHVLFLFRWWFQILFISYPLLKKKSILTQIFKLRSYILKCEATEAEHVFHKVGAVTSDKWGSPINGLESMGN